MVKTPLNGATGAGGVIWMDEKARVRARETMVREGLPHCEAVAGTVPTAGEHLFEEMVRQGRVRHVEVLLEFGATATVNDLMVATLRGHAEVASVLLRKGGVDVNAEYDGRGYTCMTAAVVADGGMQVIHTLAALGGDVNGLAGGDPGRRPIVVARNAKRTDLVDLLVYLGGCEGS